MDLSLENRDGLPEALRVLLADFPREAWEQDPNFRGLVEFWLSKHMEFRRLLTAMNGETESLLDGGSAQTFAGRISRYGSMFVNNLHGHHQIEDMHYFPRLSQMDERLEYGFELLDGDHKSLDGLLAGFVDSANNTLQKLDNPIALRDAAGTFHTDLGRLDRLIQRHLDDEEDLIVPVILKFGEGSLA